MDNGMPQSGRLLVNSVQTGATVRNGRLPDNVCVWPNQHLLQVKVTGFLYSRLAQF